VAEEPAADDVVVGAVELEEEGFADLEGAKLLLPAGLPEVNLIETIQPRQEAEPITIRDSDEETHTLSSAADQNDRRFYPRRSGFENHQCKRWSALCCHTVIFLPIPESCPGKRGISTGM